MEDRIINDVVINIDSRYLVPAAVLARQLDKFSKIRTLHVMLFESTESFQESLLQIIGPVQFRVQFYHIESNINSLPNLSAERGVPLASFGKLLIARTLPSEIGRILFLDCDVLIRKDLSALLSTDFKNTIAGVRQKPVGVGFAVNQPPPHSPSTYFNAGVLLINLLRWRGDSIDNRVQSVLLDQGPFEYMDQDVLNLIFKDDWFELDQSFNCFAEKSLRFYPNNRKNVLTHFAGGFKPWDYPLRSNLHRQWRKDEVEVFNHRRMLWETQAGYILVVLYRFLRYRNYRNWRTLIFR